MKIVNKIFFVGLFALIISNAYSQTVYLTTTGGGYCSEKWTNITTGPNGTGTQVWGQGTGAYGNGAGCLTNIAIDLTAYCGTTLYFNAYDKYADTWDGGKYSLMTTASGTIIINNSNNTPSGNGNTDASSAWDNAPPSTVELESSESFSVACACTAPTSVTLSGFTTPTCSGTSPGTFTAAAAGGSPASYTYLWYKDGVSTGVTTNTYAPGNLTANTDVYCAVSTGTGCTTNSATQTITVNAVPTGVSAVATPNPVCSNATLTLTGSATNAASWSWTGPNSFSSTSQSPTVASFAAVNEGIYYLEVTHANGCKITVNTDNVSLSTTIPTGVTASATPNPICAGGTLTLTGSAAGGTSWSWSGPNGFSSTSQNPTISGVTAADAGVYTLVATNCVGSSAGVNTASVVIVSGVPTAVSATATPNPVTQGNTLTLTGSASGATSWSWTGPNAYSSATQNPTITNIPVAGSGIYTLVASNVCGAASSASTASVTVTPTYNSWYVDDNSNVGDVFTIGSASGNNAAAGTSSNPFATLKHAVSVAIAGDVIYVDAGYYTTEISILLDNTKSGLSIIGAGSTLTFFDRSASTAINSDWFIHINTDNVTLKDFTVQGYENQGTQTTAYQSGQAITIGGEGTYDSNILLQNVIFNQNGQSGGNPALDILSNCDVHVIGGGSYCNVWQTAYTGGIGVMGTDINLLVENYILAYNFKAGGYDGGGLRIEGDNTTIVTVKNSRISNNVAVNGGGIALYNGRLTLIDCIVESNAAGQVGNTIRGGGVYISAGTASIKRCKFLTNTENASGTLQGGAISARYSSEGEYLGGKTIAITIDSCVFSGNANNEGRDIYGANGYSNACNIIVRDCQFLTTGDFNIVSDASSPASSINVTYFGTLPTKSGINVTRTLSVNTLYTPAPSPPQFSGTCGSITILPVEFLNFEGDCELTHDHLWWSTASEHNNDFFTIERAGSNAVFYELTQIEGALNTTQKTDYIFADYYAEEGVNYYRLSQTDVNGSSRELKTISVNNNCLTGSGLDISSSYNSTNNSINLGYKFDHNQLLEATVYNAMGQMVQTSEIFLKASERFTEINLMNSFSNGIYFLKLSNSSILFSDKIMISK